MLVQDAFPKSPGCGVADLAPCISRVFQKLKGRGQQHTSLLRSHYQLEYSLALSYVPIIEEQLQKHILILLQKTHLPAFSLTSSLTQTNPVVKMT